MASTTPIDSKIRFVTLLLRSIAATQNVAEGLRNNSKGKGVLFKFPNHPAGFFLYSRFFFRDVGIYYIHNAKNIGNATSHSYKPPSYRPSLNHPVTRQSPHASQ